MKEFESKITRIAQRIDQRVELLRKHELEYIEEGKKDLANDCVLKYKQLEMVSKDLWNALASIA